MPEDGLKTCIACKQDLPYENFIRSRGRPDGRYPYCRKCDSQKRASKKAEDPEAAEKARLAKKAYDASYNDKNKDRKRANAIKNYNDNKEAKKAYIRKWQKANSDLVKAYKQTSKIKRRLTCESGMSSKDFSNWKRSQIKICYWCGDKCDKNYHVDHYIPLSRGGEHKAENLVISCPTCNLQKHAKDPIDFMRSRGFLL